MLSAIYEIRILLRLKNLENLIEIVQYMGQKMW